MTPESRECEDKIIDAVSTLAASLGLNRIAGQIYAALYLSDAPLSLDDLTRILKVSKGHVSTNVRALERWQAVSSVWIKGSRKDYYQANRDTVAIISRQLQQGLSQRLASFETALAEARDQASGMNNPETGRKLKELEVVLRRAKRLVERLDLIRLLS